MENERQRWDARYAEGSHASQEPDDFLVSAYSEYVEPLIVGASKANARLALDAAGGEGRHAIWLAKRNWQVTLVDVSLIGVTRALANASNAGAALEAIAADLHGADRAGYEWPEEYFDLVVVFFYLQRELFPAMMNALRPGGLIIYKTYTTEQAKFGGGPSHPIHLLRPNELLRSFSPLRVLHYRETVKDRGVAELVAQKSRPPNALASV